MAPTLVREAEEGSSVAGGIPSPITVTVDATGHTAGNTLIIPFVNVADAGVAVTVTSVTDSKGNTWAVMAEFTRTTGPSTLSVLVSTLTTPLVSGDTITINVSAAIFKYAFRVEEWSGVRAVLDMTTAAAGGSSTTPSSGAATPATAGDLVLGFIGCTTRGKTDTFTQDTDTTDGAWQNITAWGAAGLTSISGRGGYKVITGTSAQTYDPTLGTSSQWIAMELALLASPSAPPQGPSLGSVIFERKTGRGVSW
jgi:hypothetical protein